MLLAAAVLEGLGRQLVTDTSMRLGTGGTLLGLWLLYFTLCGRHHGE